MASGYVGEGSSGGWALAAGGRQVRGEGRAATPAHLFEYRHALALDPADLPRPRDARGANLHLMPIQVLNLQAGEQGGRRAGV